jgi:hypothetical protein
LIQTERFFSFYDACIRRNTHAFFLGGAQAVFAEAGLPARIDLTKKSGPGEGPRKVLVPPKGDTKMRLLFTVKWSKGASINVAISHII